VEEEWAQTRRDGVDLPAAEEQRIRAHFASPAYETGLPLAPLDADALRHPAFNDWRRTNVSPHRAIGYAVATISLKPIGGIPGDATAGQMRAVADIAETYSHGEARVTHEQNLVLAHVRQIDLPAVWRALAAVDLATANAGLVSDIIACPGLDYCSLANARSIPIAQRISERFAALRRQHDIGPLKIKISGCINACGHHHAGHIGILGVDRKGEEFYQVMLGGSGDEAASIGQLVGPGFSAAAVVYAVETVVQTYLDLRGPDETFLAAVRRLGLEPFKERLYARG
jgi:sulfite reductase (NADPH) hemoprotein beta-component